MNCSIESLKNKFNLKINKENSIDISTHKEKADIISWVNQANSIAFMQGFKGDLFNVNDTHIEILRENHKKYESFIENIYNEIAIEQAEHQNLQEHFEEQNGHLIEGVPEHKSQEDRVEASKNVHYDTNSDSNKISFDKWVETKRKLVNDLVKSRKKLTAQKESVEKIGEINRLINEIEKELNLLDKTKAEAVYNDMGKEILKLHTILDNVRMSNDNIGTDDSIILQTNKIKERIDILLDVIKKEGDLYAIREGFTTEEVSDLVRRVYELKELYDEKIKIILTNAVLNSDIVLGHVENYNRKGEGEKGTALIEKIIELINDDKGRIDGDGLLGQNLLGGSAYNSLLTQLVHQAFQVNKAKEMGITNKAKKTLEVAYNELKKMKGFVMDDLFQKDDLGQNTQKLVSPFSIKYFGALGNIKKQRDAYYQPEGDKQEKYRSWMVAQKNNTEVIEVYKLQSFYDEFGTQKEFAPYFQKYSEAERRSYEAEMRRKLGDTAFEQHITMQKEKLNNYINYELENKSTTNPLKFMDEFSNNFESMVNNDISLLPDYITFIPKTSEKHFFNDKFRELEQKGGKHFVDFYVSAKYLLDYANKVFQSEGININVNDVVSLREHTEGEIFQSLSAIGKIGVGIAGVLRSVYQNYFSGRFESNEYKDEFHNNFSSYGKEEERKIYEVLSVKSRDELIEIAKKEGLSPKDSHTHKDLAIAIARKRINRNISLNIFKRILYATELAESINSRRATLVVKDLVQEFMNLYSSNTKNSNDYLHYWTKNNLLKTGYHAGNSWNNKFERAKVPALKLTTDVEIKLKRLYENELENLKTLENFKFKHEGFEYETINKEHYRKNPKTKKLEKISLKEIQNIYEEYLEKELEKIGMPLTLGKGIAGFMNNMYSFFLGVNIPSGFANRMQGYFQNNQGAVSGDRGYNYEQLTDARKILAFANIGKYAKSKVHSLLNKFGMQQIEVLKHLMKNLGLVENMLMEIGQEEDKFTSLSWITQFQNFMGDFAMTNPEFHNQGELFVAMIMNVEIEDIHGNKHPFFDMKRGFPYNPKTMELLPEFRTENNIANWENFVADKDGYAPQNVFLQNYNYVKHKQHGNYDHDDKTKSQSSVIGKTFTSFLKWFFENTTNQYGNSEISLATGQINVKGRSRALMENPPLYMLNLVLNNFKVASKSDIIVLAIATAFTPAVLVPLILIGKNIAGAVYNKKNVKAEILKKLNLGSFFSKEKYIEIHSFLKEVLIRSVKTTTLMLTRGMVNPVKEEVIKKMIKLPDGEKYMDDYTRGLVSEKAQELADTVAIITKITIIKLIMQYFATLLGGSDDDDDKLPLYYYGESDEEREKMKQDDLDAIRMKKIEGEIIFATNMGNRLIDELTQYENPFALLRVMNSGIYLNYMNSYVLGGELVDNMNKYKKDDSEENATNVTESAFKTAGAFTGFPKKLIDLGFNLTEHFSQDRLFHTPTPLVDEWILDRSLTLEQRSKKEIMDMKKSFNKDINKYIDELFKDIDLPEQEIELKKRNIRSDLDAIYEKEKDENYHTRLKVLKTEGLNETWKEKVETAFYNEISKK